MTEAIMTGGARTLQRADLRKLHVEASETSKGGRRLVEILGQYGRAAGTAAHERATSNARKGCT